MPRPTAGESRERVFRYVRERLLAGDPPTVREVQGELGFRAVESARAHLRALVADGRLVHDEGRSRGYRLPEGEGPEASRRELVPVLGRVQAGALTAALEDPEGYVSVGASKRSAARSGDGPSLFALRVRGDSMRDAGILEGDLVLVRPQPTAASGDIVVALVGDEATVKYLMLKERPRAKRGSRRSRIELHPANPAYEPLRPDPAELTLLGKVIEVRRYLEPSADWVEGLR